MRRGAGAVPARPHVTQLQGPVPRPRDVGTVAAPAAGPRGWPHGGPGRHLILAAPPTSRVPVAVSNPGSGVRSGGLACGGASAQGPQARPRASQASRGLGTNLALATATVATSHPHPPPSAPAGAPTRDVLGRKPRLPEVRTPRPVRLKAAAPRAWPQRPWPAWPAGDGSGGARRPPRNRALHVAVKRPTSA